MEVPERRPFGHDPVRRGVTRRSILGAAALLLPAAAGPPPASFPEGATLLVAGPGGGPVDRWAEWLAPGLGRALPRGTPVRKDIVGGVDGVTGANQFEARTVPDGGTALLLPGSAAMAWLVGDPRARFDAAYWVPALAAVTSSLVVSRLALRDVLAGARLRIAASGPAGPELPALLALDMLGVHWTPVWGRSDPGQISRGEADAVCLHGRGVRETAQELAASGSLPLFSLGTVDSAGRRQRDPDFPDTADAAELLGARRTDAALARAWNATAAASELDMAMVLPRLTPAAMVAVWRSAAAQALGSTGVKARASALGVRPLPAPAATASTAALLADPAAQLDLRRWLATRLDWRPA